MESNHGRYTVSMKVYTPLGNGCDMLLTADSAKEMGEKMEKHFVSAVLIADMIGHIRKTNPESLRRSGD
jgi:hypothetical protein